ncbi:MAG TPA: MFS transporter [Meiothermus sp.]|nr:MFS transporter [Meiothermus sp.]
MTTAQRWVITATVLGSGIVFLDSTVVNVALPRIGSELKSSFFATLEAQSYVYNGYLLSLSALLILAGALSDRYGRRRMYVWGLLGFGLTSALCGLAPNLDILILARVLQGIAGALLVPGSLALINSGFSRAEQGRAFGLWSAASAVTTILGPMVGGVLVDTLSWRIAFLINVPLVLLALYALRHVPESQAETSGRFDWLGAMVVALAVGGLAYGGIRGQERDWQDLSAFVALGIGAVATVIFPIWIARAPDPLVPPALFRSRNFAAINLSTFLIYGALYVSGYYQSLFFQGTLGYTALAAGLVGLPSGVFLALFSARVGSLVNRYGTRFFLTAGPGLMALGTLWLARIPPTSEPWRARAETPATLLPSSGYLVDVLPGILIFAAGLSLLVAPLTAALMSSVPQERSGLGSAINNAVSRVGPQLAGALIFIAITASFYGDLGARVPGLAVNSSAVRRQIAPLNRPAPGVPPETAQAAREASTRAFHLAMLLCVGLLVGGALVNGLGLEGSESVASSKEVG